MMTSHPLALLRRGLNSSLLRYLLVGGSGELLYLGLFALGVAAGMTNQLAISLAGGICLVFNAVLHARVSFRVRFSVSLFLRYTAIQALGFLVSLQSAAMLERMPKPFSSPIVVGPVSYAVWAGLSFWLTRAIYRRSSGATGLASRHTNQPP
jgi:putative flippase GtrA